MSETLTATVWREERYRAWCALNDAGVPIAKTVRNNEQDVPGLPVECIVSIRRPHDVPLNMVWTCISKKVEANG